MMKRISSIFILIFLISCNQKPDFEGIWIGAAQEMDDEVYVPMQQVMIARADGQFNAYPFNAPDSNWKSWSFEHQLLKIDTSTYVKERFDLSEEQFIYKMEYKSIFQRLNIPKHPVAIDEAQIIKGKVWESDYDRIRFNSDGTCIIESKKDKSIEQACYSIVSQHGTTFIIKKGNQIDCEKHPRFLEHLILVDDYSFQIGRWQDKKYQSIRYQLGKEKISISEKNFQTCNPYLYRNNPRHRYYYKGTFYNGGWYRVKQELEKALPSNYHFEKSGLMKVEFIVNCQGKAGRYSILQLDENYIKQEFNPDLVQQVYEFTKSLQDWKPGKNEKEESIDTYRFITYKIQDGKVSEIFP